MHVYRYAAAAAAADDDDDDDDDALFSNSLDVNCARGVYSAVA